jgi:RNA polymerase sigma-70 factor (ECF subfamily)
MSKERAGARADAHYWREFLLVLARAHQATGPGGPIEPSDLVQEVMLDAHRQRDQFRGTTDAEYKAWLRRILAGRLVDAVRAAKCEKRDAARVESLDAALAESSARLESALGASQSSPSECAIRAEDLLRLADAINKLPDAQRQVVLLRNVRGWSLDKIAAELQCTPEAVGGLFKRGLRKLRTILNPGEVDRNENT